MALNRKIKIHIARERPYVHHRHHNNILRGLSILAAAMLQRFQRLCLKRFAVVLYILITSSSCLRPRLNKFCTQVVACVDLYNAFLHSLNNPSSPPTSATIFDLFFFPPSSPLLYIRPDINLSRKASPRLCMKPPVCVGNLQHHVSTSSSNIFHRLNSQHPG